MRAVMEGAPASSRVPIGYLVCIVVHGRCVVSTAPVLSASPGAAVWRGSGSGRPVSDGSRAHSRTKQGRTIPAPRRNIMYYTY